MRTIIRNLEKQDAGTPLDLERNSSMSTPQDTGTPSQLHEQEQECFPATFFGFENSEALLEYCDGWIQSRTANVADIQVSLWMKHWQHLEKSNDPGI